MFHITGSGFSLPRLRHELWSFRLICLSNSAKARIKQRPQIQHDVPTASVSRVPLSRIARCGLFSFMSINSLFIGSALWSYENWRSRALRVKLGSSAHGERGILYQVRQKLESLIGRPLRADDVFWGIAACNALVFFGFRTPIGRFFGRYFVNSPYGPTPALSMLFSVFSHFGLVHLFVNMYVLHSFTPTLVKMIGPGEYLALFLGGGIFASFLSLLSKASRRSMVPSVGASGGICAILGAFCLLQPHARLCIPFIVDIFPHSFEAKSAAWTILFVEFFAAVMLSARSPIDHAAHLGGLLFGMYYGLTGLEGIWQRRNAIVAKWTEWRGR